MKKRKKIKRLDVSCFFCSAPLEKLITFERYDVDETPDTWGFRDDRYNRHVICAKCVRGTAAPGALITGEDYDKEIEIENEKTGFKIKLSGDQKDIWLRKQGAALKDAVDLADNEELDEMEAFIKETLETKPDNRPDIITTDDDEDEPPRKKPKDKPRTW